MTNQKSKSVGYYSIDLLSFVYDILFVLNTNPNASGLLDDFKVLREMIEILKSIFSD